VKNSLQKNNGFTLIELIVVIVILGIMVTFAAPKFIDLQSDARASVIRGVEGSIRSAATLVYSKSLIDGTETAATGTVNVSGGGVVDTVFGYPAATAAGIGTAIDLQGGVTHDGSGVFTLQTGCTVTYVAAADATTPPVIDPAVITGC